MLAPSPSRKKFHPPVFSGLICMRPSNFLDHDGVGRMAHGPTAGVHSIHLGNFFVHLGNFVSFTSLDRARSTQIREAAKPWQCCSNVSRVPILKECGETTTTSIASVLNFKIIKEIMVSYFFMPIRLEQILDFNHIISIVLFPSDSQMLHAFSFQVTIQLYVKTFHIKVYQL